MFGHSYLLYDTFVHKQLVERIRREGSIPFDAFVEHALYHPEEGFFVGRGRGAGRAGRDFVTSPEVGSLFGALVSRALDGWWSELGRPDPYLVVDAGAGSGRLAADVLRTAPACAPALRYVLVERSPALREAQRERLALEPAERALGPAVRPAHDESPVVVPGLGPLVTALDDLPGVPFDGVVVANELLDNLPFRIVEHGDGGWAEVRVGLDDAGRLTEVVVAAPPELAAEADRVAVHTDVPARARLPVPTAATEWLARCAELLHRGFLVVIDYADTAAGLAARGPAAWLRTYRAHERGGAPLADVGEQDLTYDVPVEYLLAGAEHTGFLLREHTRQREWLGSLGVEQLIEEAAAAWRGREEVSLEALTARSRVQEADALTDPSGLGAHHVFVFERRRSG